MSYSDPTISVVLPVYNGEKYLAEAIESILAQTFSDFELIVINDGSTDGTLAILQNYQADSRIRLFSRENKGLVATLNEGIDLARGTWLARMDQDDIALPQRFEQQLQWLARTDADICGSWIKLFGLSDQRIINYAQTDAAIKAELLFMSPFAHPTVMMKTALIKQLHYDHAWENAEDYDLWVRAALANWRMTNVPEVLLWYRQHVTQMSSHAATQQQAYTQKIQRRYWGFLADSMAIKPEWIDEVLKIRAPAASTPNRDTVDLAFTKLLQHHQGEARAIIFDHITRLYFRMAADCPDVVTRWRQLNKNFGSGFGFGTQIKLWLLAMLHIDANSPLFNRLKKFYFYCAAHYEKS